MPLIPSEGISTERQVILMISKDIYQRKSRWKIYLIIAGLAILAISMIYTNDLANRLAEGERNRVNLYFQALKKLETTSEDQLGEDATFFFNIVENNKSIPVIAVNEQGEIEMARNFGERDDDKEYLRKELKEIKASGQEPIPFTQLNTTYHIYYKQSRLLTLLSYFPLIQIVLLGAFIALGYIGFSASRRAEQNRVWVGMAKETAHQLGTPISAIMAWIQILEDMIEEEDRKEIVDELKKDVHRLELIAERFSKIGSEPAIEPQSLEALVQNAFDYMKRRSPRKVTFDLQVEEDQAHAEVNAPLFEWVLENVIRNALDAMEGQGEVNGRIYREGKYINVDITDTGKGIESGKQNRVFQPGYSTKKRGWGLGLSLAKRIIENYHRGKIFVKDSTPGKGTTFTISLPYAS